MKREGAPPFIDPHTVDSILEHTILPSPKEQADNLILWLWEISSEAGERHPLSAPAHLGIIGAKTPEALRFVSEYLLESRLINGNIPPTLRRGMSADVTLSMEGWSYYEELKRGIGTSRRAFMAMKYGDEELDSIVEEVFRPAVTATGFHLFKLDDPDAAKAGLIDDRMRVEIRQSRFLISDLSHGNKGAYWEAGFAEGLGKPVIYTCDKAVFDDADRSPHFDTNHHLTIVWDRDDRDGAAQRLKDTIRATLPDEARLKDD
ncbi:MAG: hypothetical protein U9Q81_13830 [Pseudomonadota bacterium]|nr:hypothetical protein [Pseudomonadota bacterium]